MNQNQGTPPDNETAMQRVLEAAQKVAPPWALPLTLDDIETHADEKGRGVYYAGQDFGDGIEGDVIVRLSMVSSFGDDGNELERGPVEPKVHIEPPRVRNFTSTEIVALALALEKLWDALNEATNGDEAE